MVKTWQYFMPNQEIGELSITEGQYMSGNIMGVLAEDKGIQTPYGHFMNAKTFDFPVRYKLISLAEAKADVQKALLAGLKELEAEGCRFIMTSGGAFGQYDLFLHNSTDLLVVSTPLSMVEYAAMGVAVQKKIVVCSNLEYSAYQQILDALPVREALRNRLCFYNLALDYQGPGAPVPLDRAHVGAFLWDSPEPYDRALPAGIAPVFDLVKIARLMKCAVMQQPYEGGV